MYNNISNTEIDKIKNYFESTKNCRKKRKTELKNELIENLKQEHSSNWENLTTLQASKKLYDIKKHKIDEKLNISIKILNEKENEIITHVKKRNRSTTTTITSECNVNKNSSPKKLKSVYDAGETIESISSKTGKSEPSISRMILKANQQELSNTKKLTIQSEKKCCMKDCINLFKDYIEKELLNFTKHNNTIKKYEHIKKIILHIKNSTHGHFMCCNSLNLLFKISYNTRNKLINEIKNDIPHFHGNLQNTPSNKLDEKSKNMIKDWINDNIVPDPSKNIYYYPRIYNSIKELVEGIEDNLNIKISPPSLTNYLNEWYLGTVCKMPKHFSTCDDCYKLAMKVKELKRELKKNTVSNQSNSQNQSQDNLVEVENPNEKLKDKIKFYENKLKNHKKHVEEERKFYKEQRKKAIEVEDQLMVSFDFRTPVTIPSFKNYSAGHYFLNRKMVKCFGVVIESDVNREGYLIFYDNVSGQKWQHVICMLDYVIQIKMKERNEEIKNGAKKNNYKKLIFRSDNCYKENKNQYMVCYMASLLKNFSFDSVSFHTLVVGHTKFSPDAKFGQLSSALKGKEVVNANQLVSASNQVKNVIGVLLGPEYFYDRKEWFNTYFSGKLSNISQLHHIEVMNEDKFDVTKRIIPQNQKQLLKVKRGENEYELVPKKKLVRIYARGKNKCSDNEYEIERKLIFPNPKITLFKEFDPSMKIRMKEEKEQIDKNTFDLWKKAANFISNEEQKKDYMNYINKFDPTTTTKNYQSNSSLNEEISLEDFDEMNLEIIAGFASIPENFPKNKKFTISNLCLNKID
jgi:hypothetical protein